MVGWILNPPSITDAIDDMRALGASEADIFEYVQANQPEPLLIEPENWPVVQFFQRIQTQWKRGGMQGTVYGLDYGAVLAFAHAIGTPITAEFMDALQFLELTFVAESVKHAANANRKGHP